MNKKAAIFHGSGGTENSYWIPWLKDQLQDNGFELWTPSLTIDNGPVDLNLWQKEVEEQSPYSDFDLMIAHSSGVPLIMKLLSSKFTTKHAISVAGYMQAIETTPPEKISQLNNFNIPNIKNNGKNFTFIHSDNDPWGCGIKQGEYMRENLGGTLIIKTGEGHFGSDSFNQPYKEFPMLLAHCLLG